MSSAIRISRVTDMEQSGIVTGLAQLLVDCVEGGASVSFILPISQAHAENFWRNLAGDVTAGKRILLIAQDEQGVIVGTVQAILSQPENQPHRADIAKLLVHRRARKAGAGAALVQQIERASVQAGKTLLVLDTVTGGDAERLYRRLNWQRCGEIPGYALMPDGALCGTTVFYKQLQSPA